MLLEYRSLPTLQRVLVAPFLFMTMLMFSFDNPLKASTAVIAGMFLMLVTGQSFIVMEKYRLETLYAILPLTRDDVVKVKYLFNVLMQAVVMLPPLLLKPLFFPNNEAIYFSVAVAFLTVSFTTAILYPLSFKIGYGKASNIFYISLIIFIGISYFVAHSLLPEFPGFFTRIIHATSTEKAIAGLLLLFLSYLLSLKIYRTSDL